MNVFRSIRLVSVITMIFVIHSVWAVSISKGPAVQNGDQYPYTQTITEGIESFDVLMDGTDAGNPNTHLYVSTALGDIGIMKSPSATNTASDYYQINPDEELHMTFSNIPAGKLVRISELSGNGNYFSSGVELYLSKNGELVETIYCDASGSYTIEPPILAANSDTISFNPSDKVRLTAFQARIINDPASNNPYISDSISSTNLFTQTITEPGHYYVTADWSELTHKPDGVAVRVEDPVLERFRFLGHMGPSVGTVDLDLLVLNPGDAVKVVAGLTGDAGEDPGEWTVTLTKYDSWSGSRYTPATVPLASAAPLSGVDLHQNLWPKVSCFRTDYQGQGDYTQFWNAINESLGHAPKCYAEERTASVDNLPHMQRYAEENPDRQALVHWNASEIKIAQTELPSGADQFKPYHFRYEAGAYLSASVNNSATTFTVSDASPFEVGVTNIAIVIPVDPVTGERDFDQCELVLITDVSENNLTVERNAFGSTFGTSAKDFSAGAYVAINKNPYSAGDTYFSYNLSVWCPRDSAGRNCADVLVDMLSSSFASGDELERFHGIMFDVLRKSAGSSEDTNLDGSADGGLDPRGLDLTHLGAYGFGVKLRNALPGRILTFDGDGSHWPRLHRVFSGMEAEGFVKYNDAYNKGWGSALNWWQYTKKWNTSDYPYIFCTPKINDLPEGEDSGQIWTMDNAGGCILGITMAHYSVEDPDGTQDVDDIHARDEFRRGVDNVLQWLGAPVGEIIRPSFDSPDVLSGADLPAAGWSSPNGSATVVADAGGEIRISGDATDYSSQAEMSVSYSGISIPEGDLVIRFEAMGDAFPHFSTDVARYIKITVDGREPSEWNQSEQEALFTTDGFTENAVFYRGAGASGGSTATLNLTIEGTSDVVLKNFTVHNATDVLLREFQHGVVLCNPSENPYTFDLASYFPGRSFVRIQGQSYDDPITNDGSAVGDTVQLDAHSGLFLIKDESATKVISFDRSGETQSVGGRSADVSDSYGKTWNFSDTVPLISSAGGTNATVYGGVINTWSVAADYPPLLRFQTSEFQNQVNPSNGSDTTAKGMLVWKKEDFLNGTSTQAVSLASGGNLSCAITAASGSYEGRFAVKQGSVYYVSETATTGTGSFALDPAGTDWAPVNVTDYSIGTYEPRLFTNVEAVGLYYSTSRSGNQSLFKFSNFDFTVPQASLYEPQADYGPQHAIISESGEMAVDWFSVYGVNYQLQGRTNLVEGIWENIGDPFFGNNGWMSVTTTPVETTSFFRILQQPSL